MTNLQTQFTISIHATHTGGDMPPVFNLAFFCYFNPRHPYGWRPFHASRQPQNHQFQSTPPIRVATCVLFIPHNPTPYFNPRHPYGWRHTVLTQQYWSCHFNPRHPYGWRQYDCQGRKRSNYFNPRHPYGWRLPADEAMRNGFDFNPRHPYGWRHDRKGLSLSGIKISIHATHTGGDVEVVQDEFDS